MFESQTPTINQDRVFIKLLTMTFLALALVSCNSKITGFAVSPETYSGYYPVPPVPAKSVNLFNESQNKFESVYWESLSDTQKVSILSQLRSIVTVRKTDVSIKGTFFGSSVSGEKGSYEVIMDFVKANVEDVYDENDEYTGSRLIGIGLRLKASIVTSKSNLKLSGPLAIGVEASKGNLAGSIAVEVIGVDSKDITNLFPLASKIDESSIQASLQALAAVKSKIWDASTIVTPHILGVYQGKPNSVDRLKIQEVTFARTPTTDCLRTYWKPDTKTIDKDNENRIKQWMEENGLESGQGSITTFLYSSHFESLRKKAVSDLSIDCNKITGGS